MRALENAGLVISYDWSAMSELVDRWPHVSAREINTARSAGMFVALAPITVGVAAEIGARLGGLGVVHLVGQWLDDKGRPHIFSFHPLIHQHEDWVSFLSWIANGDAP